MTVEEARKRLWPLKVRVTRIDGKNMAGFQDLRSDRLNVHVENNIVVKVVSRG